MSHKAGCRENAGAESFFGSVRQQLTYHETYATQDEATRTLFEYKAVKLESLGRTSLGMSEPPVPLFNGVGPNS